MNNNNNQAEKLSDVELLLPWHAAGTLSRRDAARVEAALAADDELARRYELVREELGAAIRLNETLGAPSARAMEKLFAKIDAEPPRRQARSRSFGTWLAAFITGFQPRALAYGAMAAALVIVLQAGILAGILLKDGGGYSTASLQPEEGAYVSVRFKSEASAADITRFLADTHATVVGGPTGGMFKLRVSAKTLPDQELNALARQIAANPVVEFAAAAH